MDHPISYILLTNAENLVAITQLILEIHETQVLEKY